MPYTYKTLTQAEQDDLIVSFIRGQERDKYCHELNLVRCNEMLLTADGKWRDRVLKLRAETEERLVEVNSIIEATEKQLPDAERVSASLVRLKAKEDAELAK